MCHNQSWESYRICITGEFSQLKHGCSPYQNPLSFAFAFCIHVQQLGAVPIKRWHKAISSLPAHVTVKGREQRRSSNICTHSHGKLYFIWHQTPLVTAKTKSSQTLLLQLWFQSNQRSQLHRSNCGKCLCAQM